MCDQQRLRPACAYAQTDQSLCMSLEYSMIIKLLTEHHFEFLPLKGTAQARLSLHLSKCHIVGNHMSRLIKSQFRRLLYLSSHFKYSVRFDAYILIWAFSYVLTLCTRQAKAQTSPCAYAQARLIFRCSQMR